MLPSDPGGAHVSSLASLPALPPEEHVPAQIFSSPSFLSSFASSTSPADALVVDVASTLVDATGTALTMVDDLLLSTTLRMM